jgi:serine/threonine protein kinase
MAKSSKVYIGEYSEDHLLKLAKKLIQQKTSQTRVFDKHAEASVPQFQKSELKIGRVLGRGGFCVVSQVNCVTTICEDEKPEKNGQDSAKNMSTSYAMKQLSEEVALRDVGTYVNGIVDLAMEAKWLAAIQHPHIVSIRGVSLADPCSRNYFIVIDRLHEILTMRLQTWKKHQPSSLRKMMHSGCAKERAYWLERVGVAYDVASALAYLHGSNIMDRDVKPDDIGFDVSGQVKIFDFGLAKEFDPATADKNGCFNFTACTGSPRYMAPETALGKPYNEKIDVYSYGLLLYQILALETPFEGLTMKSFPKIVYEKGARPVPNAKWPAKISSTMQRCWSSKISQRPSMKEVASILSKEIEANEKLL